MQVLVRGNGDNTVERDCASMSETAPVPEAKGLATFLCQPLSAAMVTLLLSATVAQMSETAPVPEAKGPATFLCKSLPTAMVTLPMRAIVVLMSVTALVPMDKVIAPDGRSQCRSCRCRKRRR